MGNEDERPEANPDAAETSPGGSVRRRVLARLEIVAGLLRDPAAQEAGPRVVWREGGVVQARPLFAPITVGRDAVCDVVLADRRVSRRHCRFAPHDEREFAVADLGSANGTIVNGVRLGAEERILGEGDVIEAGGVALVFLR